MINLRGEGILKTEPGRKVSSVLNGQVVSAEQSSWRRVRRHSSDYRLSTGTEQAAHPHRPQTNLPDRCHCHEGREQLECVGLAQDDGSTEEELWGLRKTLSPQYNSGEWRTRQTQMWKAQQTSWATKTTEEGAIHGTKCNLASLASYCCDRDQSPKQTDENECILAHSSQSVMESGQELSVGTGPEACSNSFWCSPEPNCPGAVFLLCWALPHRPLIKKILPDLPTSQLEGGTSLTEFSSSRINLCLCQVNKNLTRTAAAHETAFL